MVQQVMSQLIREFRPSRLLPSLTAGLVAGVLTIIVEISLAALIFSGDLAEYVSNGIGLTLFGTLVIGALVTLSSSFSGTVAVTQDAPAAILALMAAAIAGSMTASSVSEDAFITVVVAIGVTSLLTGTLFWVLGSFKLGGLVRYLPYPVVGGFLAGTGWLLATGAIGVMTDTAFSFSQLSTLFDSGVVLKWLPGLMFSVVLLLVLRRHSHFLIIPGMLMAAVVLFYVVLWLTGTSIAEASAQGWLLGPFPEGSLWRPLTGSDLSHVDWPAIFAQIPNVGTVMVISLISLLLNASGLELTVRQDIDLNRELRAAGVANFIAGFGGGPAGYHALSLSAFGYRAGSTSRLVGLVNAGLCGTMLFFGASILSYFPKPVLGGLLLFLGLSFLVEWVYDAWFKLPKGDYVIVVLILVVMGTIGVLEAVGLGVILAVVLFVVNYSRVKVVKHRLSGTTYRSNVDRPRLHRQLLREKGDWLYILELQGFIFFGTANRLLDQVRQRIGDPALSPPHFVVMDFRQVSGLDTSTVLSFAKMKQLAQAHNVVLVFTHLSPKMRRQLNTEVLTDEDQAVWRVYEDLDHGLEWCEAQMIETFESVGITARPRTVKQQLERFLPNSGRLASLMEFLAQEDEDQVSAPAKEEAPPISVAILREYLEKREVEAGQYLIHQGQAAKGLYFVETGQVTAQLEYEDGRAVRLRKMGAGTVVGEVGLYLGSQATAAVMTDRPSTVYYLSAQSLKRMEREAPDVAAAFHKFIAQLLSERLLDSTGTLQALLE